MRKSLDWLNRKSRRFSFIPGSCGSPAGQSITEIAITLPILLVIVAGILDLGRIFFAQMTLVNAAREGARYGAANPCYSSCTAIQTRAQNEAVGSIINPSQLTVSTTLTRPACAVGNAITVSVSYNYQLITTLVLGGGTIPLSAAAQMPIFGVCP